MTGHRDDQTEEDGGSLRYRCTTGHAISPAEADELTEVRLFDGAAEVRVCVEHGAPIVMEHD